MAPMPQFLTNTVERLFFRQLIVAEVTDLAGHFRLIDFSGEALRDVAWVPGQKVQFHLGNLTTRTYTPINWDSTAGRMQTLMFLHGNGPGSAWAASLKKGDACQFLGPRSSLNFFDIKGPVMFFGDETSVGAAAALRAATNPEHDQHFVFEVSSIIETQDVIARMELQRVTLIKRQSQNTHLEAVEAFLETNGSKLGLPQWVFTGKAQSIQTIRKALNARRMLMSALKVKAYWATGKTGLD
jgi:ferric-chelate reductase (NADPH)